MLTFWLINNINWTSTCKFGTYNIFKKITVQIILRSYTMGFQLKVASEHLLLSLCYVCMYQRLWQNCTNLQTHLR